MEIKKLHSDIISKIRSSSSITSVAQCVFELVCNSLDAKSTAIAVRINLIKFKIQVADNGEGITKENFEFVGIRYMTNKVTHLEELEKHLSTYGFRGEALANIGEISKSLSISSRYKHSDETFSKVLTKDLRTNPKLLKYRASAGTTVTVLGFLKNLPVRQQRMIKEIELEEAKKCLENLVIINPGTSFTLRNDVTGLLLLNSPKSTDIIGSFRNLHPEITNCFTLLKVSKNKVFMDALIHKEYVSSKKFQYVYVNKRPALSHTILKNINTSFHKKMELVSKRKKNPIYDTKKYPVFVLNIKCPQSYVDLFMDASKSEVQFKSWDLVLSCIEKIIKAFFGLDNKNHKLEIDKRDAAKIGCGVSQVHGAVQAYGFKRKTSQTLSDKDNDDDNIVNVKINNSNYKHISSKQNEIKRENFKPAAVSEKNNSDQNFVRDRTKVNKKLSGNYHIEDSCLPERIEKPKRLKSIIKKPLPIKIQKGNLFRPEKTENQVFRLQRLKINQENESNFVCLDKKLNQEKSQCNFGQKSVYSNLNIDEDNGKNLIMDMFLKSTQVFTGQDSCSVIQKENCADLSNDTIEESNFLMENNIPDTVRGINTTMSISVNIKKKRMKNLDSKISKCVQTSIFKNNINEMTSKYVQTTQKPTLARVPSNLSDLTNIFDGFKLSCNNRKEVKGNYTILINTVHKRTEFQFVRKSEEMEVDYCKTEQQFRPLKICNFSSSNEKIFQFQKGNTSEAPRLEDKTNFDLINLLKDNSSGDSNNNDSPKTVDSYELKNYLKDQPKFKIPPCGIFLERKRNQEEKRPKLNFEVVRRQVPLETSLLSEIVCESPYFSKQKVKEQELRKTNTVIYNVAQRTNLTQTTYDNFQPKYESTQLQKNLVHKSEFGNQLKPVQSPYFLQNRVDNNIFKWKNEMVPPDRFKTYQKENDIFLNNRNPPSSYLCKNTVYPKHHQVPKENKLIQDRLIPQTVTSDNALANYSIHDNERVPNNNCLYPLLYHVCCHKNVFPLNGFNENHNNNPGKVQEQQVPSYYEQPMNSRQMVHPLNKKVCYKNQEVCDVPCACLFYPEQYKNQHCDSSNIVPMPIKENVYNKADILFGPKDDQLSLLNISPNIDNHELEEQNFDENMSLLDQNYNIYNKNNIFLKQVFNKQNEHLGGEQQNRKFTCSPDIFTCEAFGQMDKNTRKNNGSAKSLGTNNDFSNYTTTENNDVKEAGNIGYYNFNKHVDLDLGKNYAYTSTSTIHPLKEGSNLEITLPNEEEKQHIIEKELIAFKEINRKPILSTETGTEKLEPKENKGIYNKESQVILDSQNKWIRKCNEDGKEFFVNKRTGMVTTTTPKISQAKFDFDRRLDLIPKGMSPVLKGHKKIDKSLSQNAKTKLHNFILESYGNELMVIKWQRFIYDDPKMFFEEIYKAQTKQFESDIPNIQDSYYKHTFLKDIVGFDEKMFKNIEIIGQVDKKFIAVLEKTKALILLFDQHAVHERIRVEQFIKDYKGSKAPSNGKLTFFMPRNDLGLLREHTIYLSSLGLDVEFLTDGLNILNIPLCLHEKFYSEDNVQDLSKIIGALLKEIIEFLKVTRASTSQLPKLIQNVISLKACRGAIKFGDSLSKKECENLLRELSTCDLPFQCAHGRPTLAPVLKLSNIEIANKTNNRLVKDYQNNFRCTQQYDHLQITYKCWLVPV